MNWFSELHRLQPLQNDLALLPVGWGNEGKGPMFHRRDHETTPEDWTKEAFTIEQLQQWQRRPFHSVGARTGLLTGPLLAFDFDGETSIELGFYPWAVTTWQVHRNNDAWRLKALFRPTPSQISQLPQQGNGSLEFQGNTHTKDQEEGRKGEALEVFFSGGRQVVVLGAHPSSGGSYLWPEGLGPEALSAPPDDWWQHAIEIAKQQRDTDAAGSKSSTTRNGTRRLDPCPICGRHSGKGGSALWCDETSDGLILCMPGSTFFAERIHGDLSIGQVVNDYALVKRTQNFLTFKPHQERSSPELKPDRRRSRPSRPSRPSRLMEVAQ